MRVEAAGLVLLVGHGTQPDSPACGLYVPAAHAVHTPSDL
jgi:hypothetical protein